PIHTTPSASIDRRRPHPTAGRISAASRGSPARRPAPRAAHRDPPFARASGRDRASRRDRNQVPRPDSRDGAGRSVMERSGPLLPRDFERAGAIAVALALELGDADIRAAVRLDTPFEVADGTCTEDGRERLVLRIDHAARGLARLLVGVLAEVLKLRVQQRGVAKEFVIRFPVEQLVSRREIDDRGVTAELPEECALPAGAELLG